MDNASTNETHVEMKIPKSLGETLFLAMIVTIVFVSVLAALFNLVSIGTVPGSAVAASIIWLLLVFLLIGSSCWAEGGIRQFVVNRVGEFAPRQIAAVVKSDAGPAILGFGYDLFNRRFYYFKVRCDGVKSVDWNAGQATSLAGRDMKDWRVAVWFDTESVMMNRASHRWGVYVVGPSRRKELTEALGARLIDMFRRGGVPVAQKDVAALQGLIGKQGFVTAPLHPIGRVVLDDDEYPAHSDKGYIDDGTSVEVVGARGLSLRVRAIPAGSGSSAR